VFAKLLLNPIHREPRTVYLPQFSWEFAVDQTADPKKQSDPLLAPGARPAAEVEDNPVTITDAQGVAHRGSVLVRTSWAPKMGCLDESVGEEFRIVLLREPLPEGTPTPEGGVAICAPDVTTRPVARVHETAAAYRTRRAEADHPGRGIALTPEHAAALSRGQLVASPILDVNACDVFSPEEPSPRLILLTEALLAQRSAEPYLRVLAATLTAPASPLRCEREGLLAALDGLLRDARGKAGDARRLPPAASQVMESLGQMARAASLAELAEIVLGLYPQPTALGEDVFHCRALVERPREAKELIRLRTFLAEAVVPDSRTELAMDRTMAQEQISFAVLVTEGHRWSGVRALFDRFRGGYRKAYVEHHRQYWREALRLHAQLMDFAPKTYALRRLNTLTELGPPMGEDAIARYEELPGRIGACTLALRQELELSQEARCSVCGIALGQEPPWQEAEEVQHLLEKALSQQLHRLSSKAVRRVLVQSGEARVQEFLQVVQASQTQSLAHVLDDELLGFLRRFLVEARVSEVLRPLVLRLQEPMPDLDPKTVDAAAEVVRRTFHDAFSAVQEALPEDSTAVAEETQAQLSAGPAESA
jgi:hypothetical protein